MSDEQPQSQEQPAAPEQLAITVGTAVPGTTTIDALFTSLFATRSGDLGAATYTWNTPNSIVATFAAGTTPSAALGSAMFCRFEARPQSPSIIKQ